MRRDSCTPVLGAVELVSRGGDEAVTALDVDPAEPVFAGHYPGFPIFPGVCLIEFADRSARTAPPPGTATVELAAVDSARFLSPVYPHDRLSAQLAWTRTDGELRCAAVLATDRAGTAAQLRLRYRTGTGA